MLVASSPVLATELIPVALDASVVDPRLYLTTRLVPDDHLLPFAFGKGAGDGNPAVANPGPRLLGITPPPPPLPPPPPPTPFPP